MPACVLACVFPFGAAPRAQIRGLEGRRDGGQAVSPWAFPMHTSDSSTWSMLCPASHIIWAKPDDCRSVAYNPGPVSRNSVLPEPTVSRNPVQNQPMKSGRAVDNCRPLQLTREMQQLLRFVGTWSPLAPVGKLRSGPGGALLPFESIFPREKVAIVVPKLGLHSVRQGIRQAITDRARHVARHRLSQAASC